MKEWKTRQVFIEMERERKRQIKKFKFYLRDAEYGRPEFRKKTKNRGKEKKEKRNKIIYVKTLLWVCKKETLGEYI